MAVADIVELQIIQNVAGQRAMNTLGFSFLTATASMAGLLADFNTNLLQTWMNHGATSYNCDTLRAVDVKPGTGATQTLTISPAKAGVDATVSDLLPPQCAAVLTWYTNVKGRSFRGRSYLTGYRESGQADGIWIPAVAAGLDTIATALLGRYGAAGTSPDYAVGVITRIHNGLAQVPPLFTVFNGHASRSTVFSQRRRTVGHGQ